MQSSLPPSHRTAGATLPEVLLAAAVASIVLGGLMIGSIALQRSFVASDRLSRSQADLVRVVDYMARDIRNATSVDTHPPAPVLLSLTAADYYNAHGTPFVRADDTPYDPVLGRTGVSYGGTPLTIRYLKSDTAIFRETVRANSTSRTQIADNVDNLSVAPDASGAVTINSSTAMHYARKKVGASYPLITLTLSCAPRQAAQ